MIKLRDILCEDPHAVEIAGKLERAFTTGTHDIAFLVTDRGNVHLSRIGETHSSMLADLEDKYWYKTNINGRIFPKSKIISFWKCCAPSEMKEFLAKVNVILKKHKRNFQIDPNNWYIDVLVPKKIYQDFDENTEVEAIIKIQEYIDRSFLYPWVKPNFNENDNYKVS